MKQTACILALLAGLAMSQEEVLRHRPYDSKAHPCRVKPEGVEVTPVLKAPLPIVAAPENF